MAPAIEAKAEEVKKQKKEMKKPPVKDMKRQSKTLQTKSRFAVIQTRSEESDDDMEDIGDKIV